MANPNSMAGIPAKGVVVPKSASKADMTGERKERTVGGVAMGKEDMVGADKKYDTGRTAGICYTHDRSHYR